VSLERQPVWACSVPRQLWQAPGFETPCSYSCTGPAHADTNFEWSSYPHADIEAAASFLEAKRLDVHQAVAAAREARGVGWIGVGLRKDRAS
jgi:hypothetical protein